MGIGMKSNHVMINLTDKYNFGESIPNLKGAQTMRFNQSQQKKIEEEEKREKK